MADPAIRIVSLTVTEGGYYTDPATGGFDAAHPDIAHDAAHPDTPRTAFGAMVAALRLRRDAGHGPFTGQLRQPAGQWRDPAPDRGLGAGAAVRPGAGRLDRHPTQFPNSMVDCIVPATGPAELALAREFGIDDAAPVTHENFRQWVIEDRFLRRPPGLGPGRRDLHRRRACLRDDEDPHPERGHQVLANAGELLSLATIADCMATPPSRPSSARCRARSCPMSRGAGHDARGLRNPHRGALRQSRDPRHHAPRGLRRVVAAHGFVLPILRDALAAGGSVNGLALVEALWARMCAGTREDGTLIEPNDPQCRVTGTLPCRSPARPPMRFHRHHCAALIATSP
jgi:mannitol 2-dehydrogenase